MVPLYRWLGCVKGSGQLKGSVRTRSAAWIRVQRPHGKRCRREFKRGDGRSDRHVIHLLHLKRPGIHGNTLQLTASIPAVGWIAAALHGPPASCCERALFAARPQGLTEKRQDTVASVEHLIDAAQTLKEAPAALRQLQALLTVSARVALVASPVRTLIRMFFGFGPCLSGPGPRSRSGSLRARDRAEVRPSQGQAEVQSRECQLRIWNLGIGWHSVMRQWRNDALNRSSSLLSTH